MHWRIKTCIFFVLFCITHVFSEKEKVKFSDGLDGLYMSYQKDPYLLRMQYKAEYRDELKAALELLKQEGIEGNYKDHMYVLAMIGSYANEDDCNKKLSEHCKQLGENKNWKIQAICNKVTASCYHVEYNIAKFFYDKLLTIMDSKYISERDRCAKLLLRCYMYQEYRHKIYKDNLKCRQLEVKCYLWVRMAIAETIVRNLLLGYLSEQSLCLHHLERECESIHIESPEMLELCIRATETCRKLVKEAKRKGKEIESRISKVNKTGYTKESCGGLLPLCYFHTLDYSDLVGPCRKLQIDCARKGFTYRPPDVLIFDFEHPPSTSMYNKGVCSAHSLITGTGLTVCKINEYTSPQRVVAYLSGDSYYYYDSYCVKTMDLYCPRMGGLPLMKGSCAYYKASNSICNSIYYHIRGSCNDMYNELTSLKYWSHYLNTKLTDEQCDRYLSFCYFLSKQMAYVSSYDVCADIVWICHVKDMRRRSKDYLMHKYITSDDLTQADARNETNSQQKCLTVISAICSQVMYEDYYVFYECLHPLNLCSHMLRKIKSEVSSLQKDFKDKYLKLKRRGCVELKRRCELYKKFSDKVENLCCEYEKICEKLESCRVLKLLDANGKNTHMLNPSSCTTYYQSRCNDSDSCYMCQNITLACYYTTDLFAMRCNHLTMILKDYYRPDEGHRGYFKRLQCLVLSEYCKRFDSICPSLKAPCEKLLKHCEDVIKKELAYVDVLNNYTMNVTDATKCKGQLETLCNVTEGKGSVKVLCGSKKSSCSHIHELLEEGCHAFHVTGLLYKANGTGSRSECEKLARYCSAFKMACNGVSSGFNTSCDELEKHCSNLTDPPKPSVPSVPPPQPVPESEPSKSPGPVPPEPSPSPPSQPSEPEEEEPEEEEPPKKPDEEESPKEPEEEEEEESNEVEPQPSSPPVTKPEGERPTPAVPEPSKPSKPSDPKKPVPKPSGPKPKPPTKPKPGHKPTNGTGKGKGVKGYGIRLEGFKRMELICMVMAILLGISIGV